MIFPLLIAIPVSFIVFAYGLWQVVGLKKKEQWPLIAVGLLAGIGSLGLLLLSLWVSSRANVSLSETLTRQVELKRQWPGDRAPYERIAPLDSM